MIPIKTGVDKDNDNSCLVCLQTVIRISEEDYLSLKSFLNHLELESEIKNTFVCEKCGEKLTKFAKLIIILEKTRLEMDYILDFIQSAIKQSNLKDESFEFAPVRKSVLIKCKERRCNPKLKINLLKIDQPKLIKRETPVSEFSDDWLPNGEDNNSTSSLSDFQQEGFVIPQATDNNSIKEKINLEDNSKIEKRRKLSKGSKKCVQCSKSFSTRMNLQTHINAVHLRLKPYMCDMCGKSFARKDDLRLHRIRENRRLNPQMNLEHVQRRKLKRHTSIKCEKCSKTFVNSRSLRIHMDAVHLGLKPYMCDICGKSFARHSELTRHSVTPHTRKIPKIPTSEQLSCEICKKSFENLRSLTKHKRYVHQERKFECEVCKKAFRTNTLLKQHVSSVHEKERHCCRVEGCDKSYSQPCALLDHYRRSHPDFIIPQKSYHDKSYFKKTENGKTVVECKFCGSQFKTASLVMRHIRRMHCPKTFLCEECGYTTPCSEKLKTHVKEVHNERQVELESSEGKQ